VWGEVAHDFKNRRDKTRDSDSKSDNSRGPFEWPIPQNEEPRVFPLDKRAPLDTEFVFKICGKTPAPLD
jgi:hypothetical protein